MNIGQGLELDWFVDDTLEQCCAVQLETSAVAIWIAATPSREGHVTTESRLCNRGLAGGGNRSDR